VLTICTAPAAPATTVETVEREEIDWHSRVRKTWGEEEEEEKGEKGRKGRTGERGRRKENDYFEKRKAHSSWVSLSFLAADLVVVFLLLLCSCWILVGFLHRCCV
jgi:hypothetical protein